MKIIFAGTRLTFEDEIPTDQVTGVTFVNARDETLNDVSGGNYKLNKLNNKIFNTDDLFNLFTALRAGRMS
jgi:hypothetical protein